MQISNPIRDRLRETTHQAVELLIATGRYNQTEACRKIYNAAMKEHRATGFTLKSFKTFHNSYRKFKSNIIKNFTKRNKS